MLRSEEMLLMLRMKLVRLLVALFMFVFTENGFSTYHMTY